MSDEPARILLVEDNETIRNAFCILLEDSGYEVMQAATGEEALQISHSRPPDLALMDLGLPDLDGLEVTRRLKADDATRDIVVVALTGRTLETDAAVCLDAGCAGYLTKQVESAQLLGKIAEYLNG